MENSDIVLMEIESMLDVAGISHCPGLLTSVIKPVDEAVFTNVVEILKGKGLLSEEVTDDIHIQENLGQYIMLRNNFSRCKKSFLTREDVALIALEYAEIPVKLSAPHYMIELEVPCAQDMLHPLLAKYPVQYEAPEVLSIRERESVGDLEPIRYLSKADVSILLEKQKRSAANNSVKQDNNIERKVMQS